MAKIEAPTFNEFWDTYGLKRNKLKAEPAWNRLTAQEKRAAIAGIPAYRAACQRQGIAMMYPQNYIRDHRWEDETEEEHVAPGGLQDPDLWHQPPEAEESTRVHAQKVDNSPSALEDMETWG